MAKKTPLILVLMLLLSSFNGKATVVDSLKARVEAETNDSIKIYLLNELSYAYLEQDGNLALFYAEKAVELSTKVNSSFGLMRSWGQMGNAFRTLGNLNKAIGCYIKGEKYAILLNDNLRKSSLAHNIGIIYHEIGQNEKAEKYFLKCIEADKINKDELSIAFTLNSLGANSMQLGKYKEAKKYLNESINLLIKTGNIFLSGSTYKNLGILDVKQNNFTSAEQHFLKAIDYSRKSNSFDRLSACYLQLTNVYLQTNNTSKALKAYENALEYIDHFNEKQFELRDIHETISNIYLKKGETAKAYNALLIAYQHYKTRSGQFDENKALASEKAFAEMATKYETEKNERELRIQKLEIAQQNASVQRLNTYMIFGTVALALLASLLFLVIRSNRIAKASNRKIQKQKEQIETQHGEISLKNKEITASIEYAKTLQDAILPDISYIKNYLPHSFVLWLPRDIVSGDFYWFYEHQENYFFAAADCTGHGVPGAFVSMTCHNILNQIVIDQHENDPGTILSKVHVAVSNVFRREGTLTQANDGMDIALVCIDKPKKQLRFSGAVNELIQIQDENCIAHKADRYPIGGTTPLNYKFKTTTVSYTENDMFYMFSDGFKDQFGGPKGKKFMNANFMKLLQNVAGKNTSEQKADLQRELNAWMKGHEQTDDILVIGFSV